MRLKVLKTIDPIKLAERIGRIWYRDAGAMALPEIETSYLLGTLRRNHYDDSEGRVRRHILLYWGASLYKTSIISQFFKKLTNGETTMKCKRGKSEKQMEYLTLAGTTLPKLMGSVDEKGRIIWPLINRPNFLISGELLYGLSTGGKDMNQIINFLLPMLEEGEGQRYLIKMGNMRITRLVENEAKIRDVHLNALEGGFEYTVKGTLIAASRILGEKDWGYIKNSGLAGRFHIVRWFPNEYQWKDLYINNPGKDETLETLMRDYNQLMWMIKWEKVETPPGSLHRECMGVLWDRFKEESKKYYLRYDSLIDIRDKNFANQTLTASAMMDVYNRLDMPSPTGDGFLGYDYIPYDEDKDFEYFMSKIDDFISQKKVVIFGSEKRTEAEDDWQLYRYVAKKLGVTKENCVFCHKDVRRVISRRNGKGDTTARNIVDRIFMPEKWVSETMSEDNKSRSIKFDANWEEEYD